MPCNNPEHNHQWVTQGDLVIEKCEQYCAYCPGIYGEHPWKYAWFLRRHVRTVHCGEGCDHEDVNVLTTWTGMPQRKPRLPYRRSQKNDKHRNNKNKDEPKTPTPNRRRMGGKSLPVKQTATPDDSPLNKLMKNTAIDNNIVGPTLAASGFLNCSESDLDVPSRYIANSEFDFTNPSGFLNNGDFNDDDPSGFLNSNDFNNAFVTPSGFHNHSDLSTPQSGSVTSSSGYYSTPPSDVESPSKVAKHGQLTVQDDVADPGLKSIRASNQAFLASLAREFRGAVAQLGQAAKNQGISPAHLQWILSEESEKMVNVDETIKANKMDVVEEDEVITVDDNDDDEADDVDDTDEDEEEDESEDMNLDEEADEHTYYQAYM